MTFSFLAAIVLFFGVAASRTTAIRWQVVFCLFGAAAAISFPAFGGAVITPSTLYLPFLAFRAWREKPHDEHLRHVPVTAVWLSCAVACGVLGAIFVPRLLAGDITILTVDRTGNHPGQPVFMPLHPVSGNLTQSGYAIGGVLAFVSMRTLLERPGRMERFRDAVLLLASLNCLAALINLAEFHLGFPRVLDYVRNAYALFDAYEGAGGLMRVHGTFSETSGFSGFTVPLFAFTFSLWMNGVRSVYSGVVWILSLTFLLLSTSTTAYVGLALYAATLIFVLTYRGYIRGVVPRIGLLVAGSLLTMVFVGSFFVFETSFATWLEEYFSVTVFSKLDSISGVERSSWNRQAWLNFIETYGLGVGLGSARASSLLFVLASNLGLLGTLFFFAFVKRVIGNPGRVVDPVTEASRQAFLAALATGIVSCGVFDLGVAFYSFAAASSLTASYALVPQSARFGMGRFAGSAR